MHDSVAVRERERRRDLGSDVGRALGVERALGAHQVAQRATFDVLHDDEVRAAVLAPVVDGDDVRVVEVGGGLRLAPEPLDERRLARVLGVQRLQRDGPVEQLVAGEEDLGHAALRDLPLDLVAIGEDSSDQAHSGPNPSCGPRASRGRWAGTFRS